MMPLLFDVLVEPLGGLELGKKGGEVVDEDDDAFHGSGVVVGGFEFGELLNVVPVKRAPQRGQVGVVADTSAPQRLQV